MGCFSSGRAPWIPGNYSSPGTNAILRYHLGSGQMLFYTFPSNSLLRAHRRPLCRISRLDGDLSGGGGFLPHAGTIARDGKLSFSPHPWSQRLPSPPDPPRPLTALAPILRKDRNKEVFFL